MSHAVLMKGEPAMSSPGVGPPPAARRQRGGGGGDAAQARHGERGRDRRRQPGRALEAAVDPQDAVVQRRRGRLAAHHVVHVRAALHRRREG